MRAAPAQRDDASGGTMILPPNAARSERRGDEISMCPLARRQAVKYKALPLEVIKMIESELVKQIMMLPDDALLGSNIIKNNC